MTLQKLQPNSHIRQDNLVLNVLCAVKKDQIKGKSSKTLISKHHKQLPQKKNQQNNNEKNNANSNNNNANKTTMQTTTRTITIIGTTKTSIKTTRSLTMTTTAKTKIIKTI